MARAAAGDAGMGFEHGRVRGAARAGLEAAWMEAAAAGRVCRARDLTLQDETLFARTHVVPRHSGEQRLRVGMHRRVVDGRLVALLDDAPEIHDGDAIR